MTHAFGHRELGTKRLGIVPVRAGDDTLVTAAGAHIHTHTPALTFKVVVAKDATLYHVTWPINRAYTWNVLAAAEPVTELSSVSVTAVDLAA